MASQIGIAYLLGFVVVLILCLYWPRTYYHRENPYMSGEDYWVPFRPHQGPLYSRGPMIFSSPQRVLERTLRKDLRKNFGADGSDVVDIVIRVMGDRIWLWGRVPSETVRVRAVQFVGQVCADFHVSDEIKVQPRPDWLFDD